MSDSLPENSFSGVLRVVKLTSGEEIIGLISEPKPEKLLIKLPARLDNYMMKNSTDEYVEYIKLTNYLSNIKEHEIQIPMTAVVYMGAPNIDLEKMYEIYFMTMQTDPKSVVTSGPDINTHPEPGLQLLNDLFNNEDFVGFVNDLIDTFEGVEILEDENDEESVLEGSINDSVPEETNTPPKPKKRRRIKPEAKKLPYNPDSPPEDPESWSDNPQDYI